MGEKKFNFLREKHLKISPPVKRKIF